MKIAITGSSGLIGGALSSFLTTIGHDVLKIVRHHPKNKSEIFWEISEGEIDQKSLEGVSAIIHLAGEGIASGRWTRAKKRRIRRSRIDGTTLISNAISQLDQKPKVLISASAIGFYGDRGDEPLNENSDHGDDFLSKVCIEWENSTEIAKSAGIRVVNLRFGIVLTPIGGALGKMILPFQLGLGGRIGSGDQFMSWIGLDDAIGVIEHVLTNDEIRGPINVVSPNPVTNREFTKTIGRVLRRPTIFPIPEIGLRMIFGEMADALLISSARVEPKKLIESGYKFRHPELESSLRHLLTNTEAQNV